MTAQLTKILCIDDEEDILQVAKLSLESVGGFTVATCGSGKGAVSQVGGIRPDLILLDAMMPEMDGPATLKELRGNPLLALVPIIFMTARVQPTQLEEYIALGASGVITKPFDPMTLSAEVTRLWNAFHAAK